MSTRSSFKRVPLPFIRSTTTYGKDTCSKLGIYEILGPYFLGKFSFSEKHSRLERRFLLRIPTKKVEKAAFGKCAAGPGGIIFFEYNF